MTEPKGPYKSSEKVGDFGYVIEGPGGEVWYGLKDDTQEIAKRMNFAYARGVADERERCAGIIFGLHPNDNEAQRIVDKIRKR